MASKEDFEKKLLAFFEEHKRSKRFLVSKIAAAFHENQEGVMSHLHRKYKTPKGLELIAEEKTEEQRKIAAEIEVSELKSE
ncbi:MAG: hypothetical protein JKY33_02240, partial [Bacteroidia bacterium]|nr:hypothetical protein [Bacteroidia bacterium]